MYYFRQVKFATFLSCLLTLLFFVFFDLSKHDPALAKINPFLEDPYDAVGSFGIQLALFSALLSLVRISRPYPLGMTPAKLSFILRGNALSVVALTVTLTADTIAMLRYPPGLSSLTWLLVIYLGGLMILAALTGRMLSRPGQSLKLLSEHPSRAKAIITCLAGFIALVFYPDAWRQTILGSVWAALLGMLFLFSCASTIVKLNFPPVEQPYEDLLDDLLALYQWFKAKVAFAKFLFDWLEPLAAASWSKRLLDWLNPRRHTWNLAILVGLGLGLALLVVEAIGEGLPEAKLMLTVLMVVLGLEGAGVLLGYLLFNQFLGIFRRAN